MKAFVTGGTGFIGSRVVRKLIERGYEVYALVRSGKGSAALEMAGAHPVWGDICDIESMREGMAGSDIVFHLAAWYKLGAANWREAEQINVTGTANVLNLAHELGVSKIIYTSTVAAYGDTQGQMMDESMAPPDNHWLTEYDRTKHKAHVVAQQMIEQGAPVIILMPGAVYGPGDPSLVGEMMRAFRLGLFPVLPGPELTLCFSHVEDVAEGHILAAEKGKVGESYFLTGPCYSMAEMTRIWAEVLGKRAPVASIPGRFLTPLAPAVRAIGNVIPLPTLVSSDAVAILNATYMARSDKAQLQLGWENRDVVEGMRDTFNQIAVAEQETAPLAAERREKLAAYALAATLVLLLLTLMRNRGRRKSTGWRR